MLEQLHIATIADAVVDAGESSSASPAADTAEPQAVRASPASVPAAEALVTHGWGRIAYNVVRSLGRRGISVALGTDGFLGMATLSRYTTSTFRHPSFVREPAEFIASVAEAIRKFSPRVYLPSEQEVMVVARFRDQLEQLGAAIPVAPFATLRVLHKKDSLACLAHSLGIPHPETIVPRDLGELCAFAREFGDPVVLKRLSSSSGRGVFYLTGAQLTSLGRSGSIPGLSFGEFLAQRYVGGAGYGVSMLFHQGKLRAKFTHKRLRERTSTGGVSTLRISVRNPLLEEYAEQLLSRTNFHGVAMVEFKYDEEHKQAHLLEVNPRFWGSLALAIHSGVDFPYLLYRMALEGDVDPVFDYRTNVQCRWIFGDVFTRLFRLGRGGIRSSGAEQPPLMHVSDDFDWRDPLPFAGQFVFSTWKYLKTLGTGPEDTDVSPDRL